MNYSATLIDHCDNPRHVGSFDRTDPAVGTAMVGTPASGEVIKLQIRVDAATGRISAACFRAQGSGATIAAGSLVAEWLACKTLDEALRIDNQQIARALELPPLKLHCAMLAEDAIQAAVQDYRGRCTATTL